MNRRDLALLSCCLCLTTEAGAEEIEQERDAATVVITAERYPRPLDKTPMSVSVLSAGDLDGSRIDNLMGLPQRMTGIVVNEASTGETMVAIRGIGTDIVGAGVENAVSVYVDGVYQSRAAGTALPFLDVDRIEVLKGPQGMLYGRNATGGAINIVSKSPDATSTAQWDVLVSDDGRHLTRGTLSGPLGSDMVLGRLSLLADRDPGDIWNRWLGSRANSRDVGGVRGTLELMPGRDFSLALNATHYRKSFATAFKPVHTENNPIFVSYGAMPVDDPRTASQDINNEATLEQTSIDATAKWDFGAGQLTSITAWRKNNYNVRQADLDGTELPIMAVMPNANGQGITENSQFLSQEFILHVDRGGPWSYLGLLAFSRQTVDAPAFRIALPITNLYTDSVAQVDTEAWALGGQATLAIARDLRLTAGARLSSETKTLANETAYVNDSPIGSQSDHKHWIAVSPKLALDYRLARGTLAYIAANKGFKSGGFNTVSPQPSFDPETATSYEAGFKTRQYDDRLRLGLSVFRTAYRDMQMSIVRTRAAGTLYSEIQNAAHSESRGLEFSLFAIPAAHWEVSTDLQLLNARLTEFSTTNPHDPTRGVQSQNGNPMPRAPDRTANLAAQHEWPMENGSARLRLECNYRSRIYYTPFKDEKASDPSVTVFHAFLTYQAANMRGLAATAFVKNIANKTYTTAIFDPPGLGYLAYFAPARTVGVQLGWRI